MDPPEKGQGDISHNLYLNHETLQTQTSSRTMKEHIKKLFKEAKEVPFDSRAFWKLRATYLEKSLDPTYSEEERQNCDSLWRILSARTK